MNTEIPDNIAKQPAGWVFYDGECHLCRGWASRLRGVLGRRCFHLLPLHSPEASARLGAGGHAPLGEMRLVLADGRNIGGADAIVEIARWIWWAWPLWAVSRFPGIMPILRAGYRVVAANRHCADDTCLITHRSPHLDWLPLIVTPMAVVACRSLMPDWVFMWVLALAIFLGCKWLTLRRAFAGRNRPPRLTALAYLFLWPGMNANAFFTERASNRPTIRAWSGAIAKTFAGLTLLWLVTARVISTDPLLTGWFGMIGVVLLLHFGLFQVLALFWQGNGRNVTPLMRAPLLATSLADFWGNRWNTAFNALAHDLAFRPLVRRIGVRWATLSVFVISGLIHDLVISLPARGGYGLPTAYFLLQGVAVLFERSRSGRALGLSRGRLGRAFMLIVTTAPVFCLFHPTFIHNVILPMLHAIGTIWNTA